MSQLKQKYAEINVDDLLRAQAQEAVVRMQPSWEVQTCEDCAIFMLDVPGCTGADLELDILPMVLGEDSLLRVVWCRKQDELGLVRKSTIDYTKRSASFGLPPNFKEDGIEAEIINGVLLVRVPLNPPPPKKKIKVISHT